MILDLPDTDTGAINKKIVALREEGGAITLGRVLTLVVTASCIRASPPIHALSPSRARMPAR